MNLSDVVSRRPPYLYFSLVRIPRPLPRLDNLEICDPGLYVDDPPKKTSVYQNQTSGTDDTFVHRRRQDLLNDLPHLGFQFFVSIQCKQLGHFLTREGKLIMKRLRILPTSSWQSGERCEPCARASWTRLRNSARRSPEC